MKVNDTALFLAMLKKAGMTQRDLAGAAGRSVGSLNEVIHGTKRIDEADAVVISRLLGCRVGVLFQLAERPEKVRKRRAASQRNAASHAPAESSLAARPGARGQQDRGVPAQHPGRRPT